MKTKTKKCETEEVAIGTVKESASKAERASKGEKASKAERANLKKRATRAQSCPQPPKARANATTDAERTEPWGKA
jgi:hypothetical protein